MALRARGLETAILIGLIAGMILVAGVSLGDTGLQAAPAGSGSLLKTASSDPVAVTNWAGYGVRGVGAVHTIPAMFGSWTQPSITCPSTFASEAIGVGLKAPPGGFGGKIDGVGTAVLCWYGTPLYMAWEEKQSTAVVLSGIIVSPGDLFQANVSTSFWEITDVTAGTTASGSWTLPPTTNEAMCVVMRTHQGLGWPALVNGLPLSNTVLFGSAFTGQTGCWFYDPGPGINVGVGTPTPGYVLFKFEMPNPPGPLIVPGGFVSGFLASDSFTVVP